MKIHFLGAAGEVTGSCFLVEKSEKKYLVDCGMFQGSTSENEKNSAPFAFDPTKIDAVFLTHAHLDHCGRIPQLFAAGYRGPVYATAPTAELASLMWEDALGIMQSEATYAGRPMLYHEMDVKRAQAALHPVKYQQLLNVDDAQFTFHDAGHILGSAWLEIWLGGKSVVFSGDIGNDQVPIICETEKLAATDLLVMESTYGDRTHVPTTRRRDALREVVMDAMQRRGMLLIAAFSLERTQEILYEFDQLVEHDRILPRVPIYLDSPLAIRANKVYRDFPDYYDAEAAAEWLAGDDFLNFRDLKVTLSVAESKLINDAPNPKIVIAGSGMLNGGRVAHHLLRCLPNPQSTLLLVSYQASGTLGRRILDGAPSVVVNGDLIPVKCKVVHLDAYSSHGDQEKLLRWALSADKPPKKVALVHGDRLAAEALENILSTEHGLATEVPQLGSILEL